MVKQSGASRFPGHGEFRGENRPYGALVTYSLNVEGLPSPKEDEERRKKEASTGAGRPAGDEEADRRPQVEIKITDADGKLVRTFKQRAVRGVNRAVWDLRRDRFQEPRREGPPSFFEPRYLEVLPGTYTVTVKYKEQQAQGTLRVVADPRYQTAPEDRQANWQTIERAGRLKERLTEAIERLRSTRDDVDVVLKKLAERKKDPNAEDPAEVKELRKSAKDRKSVV